jgi:CLIP-associating protein 1/2
MNKSDGLQFKSFVPQLVACLEDADGMVRETAKSCVVELFRLVNDYNCLFLLVTSLNANRKYTGPPLNAQRPI